MSPRMLAERFVPDLPACIGGHRVIARLAAGGMAEIFLARKTSIGGFERDVVIKRMLPHFARDPDLAMSLLDEARILGRLRHPNVVAVDDVATDEHSVFLVMEHLRGASLATVVKALRAEGRTLDARSAAWIAAEVCAALEAAHALQDAGGAPMNVVHRDVSPHNVFLTLDGEVKLLDFGVAFASDRASSKTGSGVTKGKLAYMAPEQLSDATIDGRADLWSLGVVLHELLGGTRLFARETDPRTLVALLHDRIPLPSELAPHASIPPSLEAICMRALARDRDERFPSAAAMRVALAAEIGSSHRLREAIAALAREHAEGLDRNDPVPKHTATLPQIHGASFARLPAVQPVREARTAGHRARRARRARRIARLAAATVLAIVATAGAFFAGATLASHIDGAPPRIAAEQR